MKKILVPTLLSAVIFTACSKSSMDMRAPSKVDQVLTELKGDPNFNEYLRHMDNSMSTMHNDIAKMSLADTTALYIKTTPYNEIAKKLNFAHGEETMIEWKKASDILWILQKDHPSLSALTDEERKLLFKKATVNYLKQKK